MTTTTRRLKGQQELDRIELSLIALLNAEARAANVRAHLPDLDAPTKENPRAVLRASPLWHHLTLPAALPAEPWLFGWDEDSGRLVTPEPELLLSSPIDILGQRSEIAHYITEPSIPCLLKYQSYTRLRHLPKPYQSFSPGVFYHCTYREIAVDGSEIVQQSLHGWHPRRNRYLPIIPRGWPVRQALGVTASDRAATARDKDMLVIHASLVEDTQTFWQVRLSQTTAVWLATDGEGIRDLAALRDDPRSQTGRLRPILHWVSAHLRRAPGRADVQYVREHLRGITTFALGDVLVDIREPRKTCE